MKIKLLINKFLEWCEITKNFSPNTIENYKRHLLYFDSYLTIRNKLNGDINDINIENINSFRKFLYKEDTINRKIQTVNYYIITIRSFIKFLEKKWINTISPTRIDLNNQTSNKIIFLNSNELRKLFWETNIDSKFWLRNRVIMRLLFCSWLRVSELVNLNIEDINLKTRELVIKWKWWKIRTVYISKDLVKTFYKYIDIRNTKNNALFITFWWEWWKRITRFYITNMIKRHSKKAGIVKNISAHTLRHSFATTLLNNWADLRSIQELLWHSSIKTTQLYTHITNTKLKQVHDKYFKYSI